MKRRALWPDARELHALCAWLVLQDPKPSLTREALQNAPSLSALPRPAQPARRAVDAMRTRLRAWHRRHTGALVLFHDEDYPPLLREIARPPVGLFVEGNVEVLRRPAVAIVGSRASSAEYAAWTRDLAADLARAGLVIASGMARGIDAAAHHGALDARGDTYAVLGTGTDVVYPPENVALQQELVQRGAVVSELPPGTPAIAWHFPSRNRILAGLARAVVVVQAESRSGALVTARHALAENREVMAVPGCVLDPRARGPHALLRDGAALVEDARDVLEALRWQPEHTPGATLLSQLHGACDAETLRRRLGWDVSTLQRVLAELELARRIRYDREGRVRRV